ncbi:hypothetical protein AB0F91_37835 [Amycolatopsis sp. NPDC023774]|uniref:hypothetical protein n=1 Tax=Amycolatopsis sp. NPDC023774 TaxID=3155015 RepID=UPI0033D92ECC
MAEERHVGRAAHRLHMSQPPLGRGCGSWRTSSAPPVRTHAQGCHPHHRRRGSARRRCRPPRQGRPHPRSGDRRGRPAPRGSLSAPSRTRPSSSARSWSPGSASTVRTSKSPWAKQTSPTRPRVCAPASSTSR